jgi:hypothetical protein
MGRFARVWLCFLNFEFLLIESGRGGDASYSDRWDLYCMIDVWNMLQSTRLVTLYKRKTSSLKLLRFSIETALSLSCGAALIIFLEHMDIL